MGRSRTWKSAKYYRPTKGDLFRKGLQRSRLKLTKCNATRSHGGGVGFPVSGVIKYRVVQWSWMTRIEILYIEFSHWQIMRGVSKGNLNIAVNMRATLPQTMVWIGIDRKWENRTWYVSFFDVIFKIWSEGKNAEMRNESEMEER